MVILSMKIIIVIMMTTSLGCSKDDPLVGRNCVYDDDCCEAYDEGECGSEIYCDNSAHPGQCLMVCTDTSECNNTILGSSNVCIIFDFGGRCLRKCSKDRDCALATICEYPPIENYSQFGKVCFPN